MNGHSNSSLQGQKRLADLFTPCAIVSRPIIERNISRMNRKLDLLGVQLRPHVKTTKCIEIARMATEHHFGGITVSTIAEASYFAQAGFTDILYAVGIVPSKLAEVAHIRESGVDIKVILDSSATAREVADWGEAHDQATSVLLEINSDDHRAGLEPDDRDVAKAAEILAESSNAEFRGVMTHAGASYDCQSTAEIAQLASQERDAAVTSADRIRDAGIPCPIVSVGSTPTALFASDLAGITEVRAGVFLFFDLFQTGLGVCTTDDIALSVLTTVIGHKPRLNRLLTDAGSLALSNDRGTASQSIDRRYGLVCTADSCDVIDGLIVDSVNQEHGLITSINESLLPFDRYPIGAQFRILPNHACMTAAAYDEYHVLDSDDDTISAVWTRCRGWQP